MKSYASLWNISIQSSVLLTFEIHKNTTGHSLCFWMMLYLITLIFIKALLLERRNAADSCFKIFSFYTLVCKKNGTCVKKRHPLQKKMTPVAKKCHPLQKKWHPLRKSNSHNIKLYDFYLNIIYFILIYL